MTRKTCAAHGSYFQPDCTACHTIHINTVHIPNERRERIATTAMAAMIGKCSSETKLQNLLATGDPKEALDMQVRSIISMSLIYADALIKRLDGVEG